jgi:hypothetical protein
MKLILTLGLKLPPLSTKLLEKKNVEGRVKRIATVVTGLLESICLLNLIAKQNLIAEEKKTFMASTRATMQGYLELILDAWKPLKHQATNNVGSWERGDFKRRYVLLYRKWETHTNSSTNLHLHKYIIITQVS